MIGNQAMLWRETAVLQRALTGIEQTGVNCGIFAMAMALQEFLGGEGGDIAKQLEGTGPFISGPYAPYPLVSCKHGER